MFTHLRHILFIFFCSALFMSCHDANDQKLEGDMAGINQDYVLPPEKKETKAQQMANWPKSFGFGEKASKKEIQAIDISIRPDGKGLPKGTGKVKEGRAIYLNKCASCHGQTGTEGPQDRLVAGPDSRSKTIGNYWPYPTTIYDYIRRAMPYNAPGSLSNEEVYHLTAFLLCANGIIDSTQLVNDQSLPKIAMPARKLFVADDRKGGAGIR